MTGVYCDNQPDFTWLKPYEEKRFTQYFMPYKAVGQVKNATIHAVLNAELDDDGLHLCVYATERYKQARVRVQYAGKTVYEDACDLSPTDVYQKTIAQADLHTAITAPRAAAARASDGSNGSTATTAANADSRALADSGSAATAHASNGCDGTTATTAANADSRALADNGSAATTRASNGGNDSSTATAANADSRALADSGSAAATRASNGCDGCTAAATVANADTCALADSGSAAAARASDGSNGSTATAAANANSGSAATTRASNGGNGSTATTAANADSRALADSGSATTARASGGCNGSSTTTAEKADSRALADNGSAAAPRAPAIDQYQLCVAVYAADGAELVSYQPKDYGTPALAEPAQAAKAPRDIQTNEELLLTAQHIEQYRHATFLPDPYYIEGLKRDDGDARINNAYGLLLLRRGAFKQAESHFRTAIKRLTALNPNPYNSEPYYNLGLSLFYQTRYDDAYDAFFKATWSNEQQEMAFYYLAALAARKRNWQTALDFCEKSLVKNSRNVKARALKAALLHELGRADAARAWIAENLAVDSFDYVSRFEQAFAADESARDGERTAVTDESDSACNNTASRRTALLADIARLSRGNHETYLAAARDYAEAGLYRRALAVLAACPAQKPLIAYYTGYYREQCASSTSAPSAAHIAGTSTLALSAAHNAAASTSVPSAAHNAGVSTAVPSAAHNAGVSTATLSTAHVAGASTTTLSTAHAAGASTSALSAAHNADASTPALSAADRAAVAVAAASPFGATALDAYRAAESLSSDYCFPNTLEDILALTAALGANPRAAKAHYYLGCLYYDKLQYEDAISHWEQSAALDAQFATVQRNLAIAYYNKRGDKAKALSCMERAFALNPADARAFLERDQLYQKMQKSAQERLAEYRAHLSLIEERDDLYTEYVTVLNLCGDYKGAHDAIARHQFQTWEGAEGKITGQFKLSLLEQAEAALLDGSAEGAAQAVSFLTEALSYPQNLGEGRLEGTKDNHLYYTLALAYERLGKADDARACYEQATLGAREVAGVMYYYDQPADMILYQGLALKKLRYPAEANARFYQLLDYGERHLHEPFKMDYFAVSMPDMSVFDADMDARTRAHCHYLLGLGNLGLGNRDKACAAFAAALSIEKSHQNAARYRRLAQTGAL